jgi:hypothetical protein
MYQTYSFYQPPTVNVAISRKIHIVLSFFILNLHVAFYLFILFNQILYYEIVDTCPEQEWSSFET